MAEANALGQLLSTSQFSNLTALDPAQQQAIRRQMYAQSLMSAGSESGPVASPWQAAARAVQGIVGGWQMGRAGQDLTDYAKQSREAVAEQYAGTPIPGFAPVGGTSGAAPAASGGGGGGGGTSPVAVPANLEPIINDAAAKAGVPPDLFKGVLAQESEFGKSSPNIGRITADTAAKPGYGLQPISAEQINDPVANINFSAQLFAAKAKAAGLDLSTREGQDKALQLYNGGGDPNYVQNVRGRMGDGSVQVADASGRTGAPSNAPPGFQPTGNPQQDAAAWGMAQARMYQQKAVAAAQSPYAAVRAMAPQYMQMALQAAQQGRYQVIGYNSAGQMLTLDRASGKIEAGGSPPSLHDTPGGYRGPSGNVVVPWEQPGGGANPSFARQNGVPTAPGNPYQGMSQEAAGRAYQQDRENDQKGLGHSDEAVPANQDTIRQVQRARELLRDIPLGSDWLSQGAQWLATKGNNEKYQEFLKLTQSLALQQQGTGNSHTDANMGIIKGANLSEKNSAEANEQILAGIERRAQLAVDKNRYQHDYFEANGTLRGSEQAWDAYMKANPLYVEDKQTGRYVPNPNLVDRRDWFRQNTDPKTGGLNAAPSPTQTSKPTAKPASQAQPNAPAYPEGTIIKNAKGERMIMKGGAWVPYGH